MEIDDLDRLAEELDAEEFNPEARSAELIGSALKEIRFHARNRFLQFTPNYPEAFEVCLGRWLSNKSLTRQQIKTLLRIIPHIQFIDRDDLLALYSAAFTGAIRRWLLDRETAHFAVSARALDRQLRRAVSRTWFSSITDSLDLAQFHHVNRIASGEHRPNWRLLKHFGDPTRVQKYVRDSGIDKVVILEDFVGSGTQAMAPLVYACETLDNVANVLFVPLVISEIGRVKIEKEIKFEHFSFDPVFVVPKHVQLRAVADANEPTIFAEMRDIVLRSFEGVRHPAQHERRTLRHPFGFGRLGMLLVLYTNCPNNTLPLIWHESDMWSPLFRRVSRG